MQRDSLKLPLPTISTFPNSKTAITPESCHTALGTQPKRRRCRRIPNFLTKELTAAEHKPEKKNSFSSSLLCVARDRLKAELQTRYLESLSSRY